MNENKEKQKIKDPSISEPQIKEYVLERFDAVKNSKTIKNLIKFHTMNKYMLMSHDPEELKKLGNAVAEYKKIPFFEILEYYESHLIKALENQPNIKKHTNVLLHIFGYFSKDFTLHEQRKFFQLLANYKDGRITLGEILSEMHVFIFKFNNTYLASQTYFLLYSEKSSELIQIFQNQKERTCI